MGLINRNKTSQPATETAKAETTPVETQAQNVEPEVQQPVEEKQVTVRKAASVPSTGTKAAGFWLSNPDVQQIVDDAQYGDFPSIIASQGSFKIASSKDDVGNIIEFQAIQAKRKKVCSPNSNDDEAKEYFAAAYEGENAIDGRTIEQCVEDAIAAGYEKADIKNYVDLYALVTANASDKNDISGEFVVLQLAPMSVIEWNKFSKRLQMKAAFGQLAMEGVPTVRATATVASNAAKKEYTHYVFSLLN